MPDFTPQDITQTVNSSSNGRFSIFKNKPFLYLILVVLLVVGSFLAGVYYQNQRASASLKSLSDSLPIPLNILGNPIISSFWGNATGTISSKDDNKKTITLTSGSNSITIVVGKSPLTYVYDVTIPSKPKQVTFAELMVNSEIDASFTLAPKSGALIGVPGDVVARTINITKK